MLLGDLIYVARSVDRLRRKEHDRHVVRLWCAVPLGKCMRVAMLCSEYMCESVNDDFSNQACHG